MCQEMKAKEFMPCRVVQDYIDLAELKNKLRVRKRVARVNMNRERY